eukprot:4825058-Amphidinium_carterae.1
MVTKDNRILKICCASVLPFADLNAKMKRTELARAFIAMRLQSCMSPHSWQTKGSKSARP